MKKAFFEPKPHKAFRDNYLAAVMMVMALLITFVASAQLDSAKYSRINGYGFGYKRFAIDSILMVPLSTSPHIPYRKGGIRYNPGDSTLQLWTGYQWRSIVTGGTGIDTAYAYDDSTLAIETPNQVFFIKLKGQNVSNASLTATGDYIQNWADHWFFLHNLKALELTSDRPDPNHPDNNKVFRFYSDSTEDATALQLTWGLKDQFHGFTDSIHFELNSSKDYTYLTHWVAGGTKYVKFDLTPAVTHPGINIFTGDAFKNGFYQFASNTATIQPGDSVMILAVPATTAPKILGFRSISGNVGTVVAIDPPSGSASRFGIEDETSTIDRRIGMNYHNLVIDSAGLLTLHSHVPGQNSYFLMNGAISMETIDTATGQAQEIGIYPDQIQVSTPYAGVPPKMVFSYSDSLRPSDANFKVMVMDHDTVKVVPRDSVGGGGSATLSNQGSGYRLVKTSSGQVKTTFAGYGILKDSTSNTNGITDKADTGTLKSVYLPLYLPGNKTINQAGNNITFSGGGKVSSDSLSLKKTIKPFIIADSVDGFGHSIMAGTAATTSDSNFLTRVGRSHGLFVSNQGVPSSLIWSAVKIQMGWINVGHNAYTVYMPSLNDIRTTNILTHRTTINAIVNGMKAMWMNHMAKASVGAGDGSITRSGSWNSSWNATVEAGKKTNAAYTSSAGAYAEYSFTDSTVGVQFMGNSTGGATVVTISIDGSTVETFDLNNQNDGVSGSYMPTAKFYTGLSNTSHTIRVTNTSGDGLMIVDYFTNLRDAATAPPICFFHEPHMDSTGYSGSQASDAAIDTINVKYDSLRNSLPAPWKARTIVAKTNTRYVASTSSGLSGDHIHPNNTGHGQIALTEMDAVLNVVGADSGTIQYSETGKLYVDAKEIAFKNDVTLQDVLNNGSTLTAPSVISGTSLNFNGFSNLGFNFFKIIGNTSAFAHGTLGVQGASGGLFAGDRSGDTTKGFIFYVSAAKLNFFDTYNGRGILMMDTSYRAAFYNNALNNTFVNPSATIHIGGNDNGVAGHAPLKINGGLLMSTPESNAIENDSTDLYFTNQSGVRQALARTKVLRGSTTWDPPSISANSSTTTTITVTGASLGDPVTISKTSGSYSNGEVYFGYVSSTNTVTIQLQNASGGTFDITSATYNVIVLKY